MTQFRVDSDAVAHATSTVQASVARIQAEVAQLRSQLGDLQSSWSGPAATAFQGTVDAWHQTQLRVEESLSSLSATLNVVAGQYSDMELGAMRMFSN